MKNEFFTKATENIELVQKRKIYGNHLKSYLMDLQNVRNFADYKLKFVSKKVAYRQLKKARELVEDVTKEIEK